MSHVITYREPRRPTAKESREIDALTESLAERQRLCVKMNEFYCPLCLPRRRHFTSESAFWSHMRAVHHPMELYASADMAISESIESALIRIVNSATHEEAIEIATGVLAEPVEGRRR